MIRSIAMVKSQSIGRIDERRQSRICVSQPAGFTLYWYRSPYEALVRIKPISRLDLVYVLVQRGAHQQSQ